ncbi:MAG: hypothetical protein KKD29_05675, partial [Candidatus Omnitrophica bacterium]|nr:hypothetical protein [Candidatus Omnitrophota bacterium]
EENKTPRIDIVGDSLYIDGKKFFVKGVGYSPFRPGVYPGAKVPLDIVEADFKRIKEAGFNTVRVWGIMPEEQITLAEKYDIKVIQAAGVSPNSDFTYEGFIRQAESQARQMARISKNHPNVIMYLVTNEPHSQAIVASGVDKTLDLYKKLIGIIKKEDPLRPVSMANAYWTIWLDQSMWDVLSFNVYNYCPSLVEEIGYPNFVKNIRELSGRDKPFLVTEYGLSVSPEGPGKRGYGGNTQEEQAEGVVEDLRGLIQGGAIGGCVFEWNDEWWKAGNAAVHDSHPEEWFGIIGIEARENPQGNPRKAYNALKEEFKMLVIRPIEGQRIWNSTDIEVNAMPEVRNIRYKIDEGDWVDLGKDFEWWRGFVSGESLTPGVHVLTVKGISGSKNEITRKLNIIKCASKENLLPPVAIELTADKPFYVNGDVMKIKARLTDRSGTPLENYPIKIGVFNSINNYSRMWQAKTNDRGFFTGSIPVVGRHKEWYYVYWVSADSEDYGYKAKESRMGCARAEARGGYPLKWITAKKAENIVIDGIMEDEWLKTERITIDLDNNFVEGEIEDNADLSAEARVLWDEGNLYILVRAEDNFPMTNGYEKWDLWKGDCAELFLSVDPSKIQEKGYTPSDFQILIGTNGKMWISNQAEGGVRNNIPVLSSTATKVGGKGYVLEAKINVSNFWNKPFRTFKSGEILGFDIALGDADESMMRKAKLVWNGTEEGYKDAAVWGRLKLE